MSEELDPGWYFYLTEYPEEGSDGPFHTEQSAILAATESCENAYGPGEHTEFTVWEKR